MLEIGIEQAKAAFFDTEKVLKAMDRAERKSLSKDGAFIRRRARSSIRKRNAVSAPGQPPSDHGGALKRFLLFSYDFAARSVVIGPTLWGPSRQTPRAAQALESGGTVATMNHQGKPVRRLYRPRPFMGPALQAEMAAGTIADQFRGSLKA